MTHPALAQLTDELRARCPEDFRDATIYTFTRDELPQEHWFPGSVAHVLLDVEIQPWLGSLGVWNGRGYAAAFDLAQLPGDALPGVYCHEAAHWLCGLLPTANSEHRLAAVAGWNDSKEPLADFLKSIDRPPMLWPWDEHGLDFIRAGLHVWSRFDGLTSLAGLRLAGPRYGLSDFRAYRQRFDDELCQYRTGSIRELLKTPCPTEAVQLFEYDTAAH